MRIRSDFAADRESETITYKPKFFIASEGSSTEPKYFDKLNKSVISENVTIINILRDYADKDKSNPTFIANLLGDFLENSSEELTKSELQRRIQNWNHENPNRIDIEKTFSKIDELFPHENDKVKTEALDDLFMDLFKGEVYEDLAKNFIHYFRAQDVTYSPTVDTLNMVVDRDKDSFTETQYDTVLKFCKENNVNLFVSNPNFEFWLYLHFPESEEEDNDTLLENKKVGQRRYIEKRLNQIFGYNKKTFNFEVLELGIKAAIIREKKYEEDIEKIKTNLGTNVGKLVERIINEETIEQI